MFLSKEIPLNKQLTVIELCIFLYLSLPSLFFMSFFPISMTIPVDLFILWQMGSLIRHTNFELRPPCANVISALLIAGLFAAFIGLIPIFQMTGDWMKHLAVFNDLKRCAWPPHFGDVYLRYYVGYYTVPAALAKLITLPLQYYLLYIWTTLGLAIVFLAIAPYRSFRFVCFILGFMFFSGFDLLGGILSHWSGEKSHAGLEWWSNLMWFQYLGMTNLFLWVPQHALPAWMLVSLFFNRNTSDAVLSRAGFIFSTATLWSIFSPLGAFPFFLIRAIQQKKLFVFRNLLAVLFVGVPILAYLLSGANHIPKSFIWKLHHFSVWNYFLILFVEMGIWVIWLLIAPKTPYYDPLLVLTLSILLFIFPLFHIGVVSDFTMRTAIPSLSILALLVCHVLVMKPIRWPVLAITVALLLFASVSPLLEIAEAFHPKVVTYEWTRTLKKRPQVFTTTDFIGSHAQYQLFAHVPFLKNSKRCSK